MADDDTGVNLRFAGRRIRAQTADTFLQKLKGLRFADSGQMFFRFGSPTRTTVDTIFVRDVQYLYFFDADRTLVEQAELSPNRFYRPNHSYRYLLETFEDLGVETGERLEIVDA